MAFYSRNKGKNMYVPPDVLSMLDTIGRTKNKKGADAFKEMANLSRIGLEIDFTLQRLDIGRFLRKRR